MCIFRQGNKTSKGATLLKLLQCLLHRGLAVKNKRLKSSFSQQEAEEISHSFPFCKSINIPKREIKRA